LDLAGIGASVTAEKSVRMVFEANRESQDLGSEIEGSIADSVGTVGFGDYEIVHDGW
jgi:hypothetical protein